MTTNTGGTDEDGTSTEETDGLTPTDSSQQSSAPDDSREEAAPEESTSEDTTPRLSIPSNLWDTGLFKPAWARAGASGTPDSPPPLKGSLLSRPEDLDPQPPEVEAPEVEAPEVEAPEVEAPEVEAPEVEAPEPAAPAVEETEDEAPEMEAPKAETPEPEASEPEPSEVAATEAEPSEPEASDGEETEEVAQASGVTAGFVADPTLPRGIDPDLVVPAALGAMAFAEEPPPADLAEESTDAPDPTSIEDASAADDAGGKTEAEGAADLTEPTDTGGPAESTETSEDTAVGVIEPVIAPIPVAPVDEAPVDEAPSEETPAAEVGDATDPEPEQTTEGDLGDEPDAAVTAERPSLPDSEEPDATAVAALSPIAAAETAARAAGVPAPEAPQTDGQQDDAASAVDSTQAAMPALDATQAAMPPVDATQVAAPPVDATQVAAPPVDATQVAMPATTAPTAETPTGFASTAETVVVPTAQTPGDHPDATATADGTGRRGRGLVVLLVVALVLALVGGGWFWWQRSQDGPIREAFADSHGAFVSASSQLQSAESLDDVAAAADDFSAAVDLLEETQDAADGRTSSLSASVRRAVDAELEVARAAEQLGGLAERDFTVWGAARADLRAGLESLEGVHPDITAAGGSTEDLPTSDVVDETDAMVGQVANRSARQRTRRAAADLASAELIADLRKVGRRAGNGATQLGGAVDSLSGADVDTAGIEAHRAVAEALSRLTRLKPATLNEWQPMRARVVREAADLPEDLETEVTSGLSAANTMVSEATDIWEAWQDETEGARTAKADDIEAVQDARAEIDTVLDEFEGLDEDLAGYLSANTASVPGGPTSEALTTLTEAADARDGLRTRVVTLGTPSEVAEEIAAIADALAVHAGTVRSAADATGACVLVCQVVETPQWQALVAQREGQAADVLEAVEAWRTASKDALKEIRQRELPDRPKI